jgi:N-acyl homoserine lactone hydrolase
MRLYLMQLALFQPMAAPIPGYVIQTDEGINILVDTGLPYSAPDNLEGPAGLQLEMNEADHVVNQLGRIGLRQDDIDLLVCTHFDADHAGNHELFPTAELIVQRRHYEIARAGYPRFAVMRDHWDHPSLRYRLIDGDTVLVPGVELIETSGHVPGHQSVLVRLPETGPVILAIDAIADHFMLDPDSRPIHPTDEDEIGVRASTRKLVDLAQREGVVLIVHGHDPQQWPMLKHAPEFYA